MKYYYQPPCTGDAVTDALQEALDYVLRDTRGARYYRTSAVLNIRHALALRQQEIRENSIKPLHQTT